MTDAAQDRLSRLGAIFIAPMIVAFSGALYVAGSVAQDRVVGGFGLDGAVFRLSLQDTMVDGFLSVIIVSIMVAFLLVGWLVAEIIAMIINFFIERPKNVRAYLRESLKVDLPRHPAFWATAMIALLLVTSMGAGIIVGELLEYSTKNEVADGCPERCYAYRFGREQIVGLRVAANSERLAIATRSGLEVRKVEDLQSVRKWTPPASQVRQRVGTTEGKLVDSISESVDPIIVPASGEGL